jgi:hypothetical protein
MSSRVVAVVVGLPLQAGVKDQADRAISTGRLRALPHVHARPIDVVVCHGS